MWVTYPHFNNKYQGSVLDCEARIMDFERKKIVCCVSTFHKEILKENKKKTGQWRIKLTFS